MTHYEHLGVDRKATPDELREAYRRAARAAHPDRHGDSSAGQMAMVNEAWRVLGDPARRAAYDHVLAAADEQAGAGAPSSAARPARTAAVPPVVVPVATGIPARFPWRFMAGMAVAGIALVVIGAWLTEPGDPARPDGILHPGECVALASTLEASEVVCDGTQDAIVRVLVPFDQECPTGTEGFRDRQGMGIACVVRRAVGG